ncbi:uncharacterized protein LOC129870592 [Solanum dulcamara]|uniref:uncharacterized protein LOC129870592 n=1 Tax=Solanum dulcamara TaxID=45834 RepID=UPI0024860F23|nr:uncharacterized protein LOC129870592 [Solanum dulcamara]
MASQKVITVITTSSDSSTGDSHPPANCPKGQCLCSPTTHRGSFRCRYHRTSASGETSTAWFKRSKSIPVNNNNNNNNNNNLSSISPKSVEST